MSYRTASNWNEQNEIRCLIIFKRLQEEGFPRGRQAEYCRELSRITGIPTGSISAKVCNYKSLAGVNADSNASVNTVRIYKDYGQRSVRELEDVLGSSDRAGGR